MVPRPVVMKLPDTLQIWAIVLLLVSAFALGWFLKPDPSPSSRILPGSTRTVIVRERDTSFVPPAITGGVLQGRSLTPPEKTALAVFMPPTHEGTAPDSDLCAPFAIDTALCRLDGSGSDTVKGYVFPRFKSIINFRVSHAPVKVVVRDSVIRDSIIIEKPTNWYSIDAEAQGDPIFKQFEFGASASATLGNMTLFINPQFSTVNGPNAWLGLRFHIY